MSKLRHKEVKQPAQGNRGSQIEPTVQGAEGRIVKPGACLF